ncbi:hypothetical protein AMTRI_Chr03g55500 [Amborella trichopoda]
MNILLNGFFAYSKKCTFCSHGITVCILHSLCKLTIQHTRHGIWIGRYTHAADLQVCVHAYSRSKTYSMPCILQCIGSLGFRFLFPPESLIYRLHRYIDIWNMDS